MINGICKVQRTYSVSKKLSFYLSTFSRGKAVLLKVLLTAARRCYRYVKGVTRKEFATALDGYAGDKKLGIDTGYYNEIVTQNSYGDSVRYEPTKYSDIQRIIDYLKLNENDVFVDYGCGKGRVIASIAALKIKKVIGIELDDEMIKIARKNICNLKIKNTGVEVINKDANNFNPIEGTIFFLFNPFGQRTLQMVLKKIEGSLDKNPRSIKVVYHNSTGVNILEDLNWLELDGEIENSAYPTSVWRNLHTGN